MKRSFRYYKGFGAKKDVINPASANQWLIKESAWFTVSYSLAEEKLKQYYFSMSQKTKDNAIALAERNSQLFSTQAMDQKLHAILDKYIPEFAVEQKIMIPQLKMPNFPKPNLK